MEPGETCQTSRWSRLWRAERTNLLLCLLGSAVLALGVTGFLQPNRIATGGTPGMAILISHLLGLSVGTVMLAINVPLLVIGGWLLGAGFVWRTVAAVVLISGMVDVSHGILAIGPLSGNPLLAAAGGGAAIGLGVGLILKGNASAGGPTIIARVLASRTRLRPGRVILAMDAVIVASSILVFGAVETGLWSLLSVVVTGRCIDLVLRDNLLRRWVTPCRRLVRGVLSHAGSLPANSESHT